MNIFCNNCRHETNHHVKSEHISKHPDVVDGRYLRFWEERRQRFLICKGCEKATLEVGWTHQGAADPETGERIWSTEYFPKRVKHNVGQKQFKQLPDQLDTIYRETIQAYNVEAKILTAVGLRSLIEGICKDQNIGSSGDRLEKRIDKLDEILPSHIVSDLHEFRFMGNEAVHELESSSEEELAIAIEICEDLLNYIYKLDYKVSELSKKRNQDDAT